MRLFHKFFCNLTGLEFQIVRKSNCLRKKCTKIYLANLRIKKEKTQMNIFLFYTLNLSTGTIKL